MASFKRFRLGDICRIEKGQCPTLKTEAGPYPMVVTAAFRRSASSYQFDCEAVCVPLISSTGHGNAAIHRVHYESGRFALANLLVALIPVDGEVCFTKYLYYLLQAGKDRLLVPLMKGTANVSLKSDDIANLEIDLPPLELQRQIVERVDSLTGKLNTIEALRTDVISETQALLSSAFADLIDGASYRPMAEVAPIVRRRVDVAIDGEYPELGVRAFGRGIFHKPTLHGAELDWQKLFRVCAGDLVISNIKAWEGAISVATEEDDGRVGSHRYLTCVPVDGVCTSDFLCFYLLSDEGLGQIQTASPGSADRNRTLAMQRLEQIEVPIPNYDKQLRFNALQAKVAAIRKAQADNQTELDALMPSVLDRDFAGVL